MDSNTALNKHTLRLKKAVWLIVLVGLLIACDVSLTGTTPPAALPPDATVPAGGATAPPAIPSYESWLQIYFTDPLSPASAKYEGGPDETIAKAIDSARLSVDVAAYNFNLWSLRDALVHAEKRGVTVRMVMESDNMDVPEVQDLKDAGIPIRGDQREGLMHNKFIVIDRAQVWTGSMNFSAGGTYRDNNNLLCIHSTQVAQDYTTEFEEMFIQNRFGTDGKANTPYPKLTIEGVPVEIYFSPDDGVAKRIVELIGEAQSSIYFMAYTFTSNDIGAAMVEKAKAGVTLGGVLDKSQVTATGSEYDTFQADGLDVRLDSNPEGLMHHKVIIIDESIVITGSYNFTASAEDHNDENTVIIFDRDVAARYMEEYRKVSGMETTQPLYPGPATPTVNP